MNGADTSAMPPPQPAPAQVDPLAMVTALVSEKTGYPGDMLDADMDLEGELGVDSIKQVEILSTLRERLPSMPEVEPERLAELRTIRLVADFISDQAPGAPGDPVALDAGTGDAMPVAAAGPSSLANGALTVEGVRGLIAEKTGYPPDLLDDDMDLEGELGIDSIKQVEILSALRDSHPGLPEVEPEQLAELRTIRRIADFFG
jgi:acyl carrier protein